MSCLLRIFFDLGYFLTDMVHCCVPRCTNYSAKTAKAGFMRYHKIPSQLDIQKAWFARLQRANLPPLKIVMFAVNILKKFALNQELIYRKNLLVKEPDAAPTKFIFSAALGHQTKRPASEELNVESVKR